MVKKTRAGPTLAASMQLWEVSSAGVIRCLADDADPFEHTKQGGRLFLLTSERCAGTRRA